uniref:Putative homing endonuclease n=1 Tax=viral metagenome TaxID=1070528 RepID=A0A6M3IR36_9ZZZZ
MSLETRKAYMERFRQEHKKERSKANCIWAKAHKDKVNQWARNRRRRLRVEALRLLGGKCVRCGFTNQKALQIDHINGKGRQNISSFSNSSAYLKAVIVSTENKEGIYQLLCANCNQIKRYEDC